MRRILIALLVCVFSTNLISAPTKPKKLGKPCKKGIHDIAHCSSEGCGDTERIDPNLNLKKNLTPGDSATQGPATAKTIDEIKALPKPKHFQRGDARGELEALGEGKKVVVTAFLLLARDEPSGESCNCNLHSLADTDNHLVLVSEETLKKFPMKGKTMSKTIRRKREKQSITAEFTPRVRAAGHPNLRRSKLDPLIEKAAQHALLVRVTGMLMFDSQHFLENPLLRANNWELHPVLEMEYCTTGSDCAANGDAGWKSLD